jgi:hypothetical protein
MWLKPGARESRIALITAAMYRPEVTARLKIKSPEAKMNIAAAQRRPELRALHSRLSKGERNYFYGKPGTNLGKFGKDHPMFGYRHTPEMLKKYSERSQGKNNYFWNGGTKLDPHGFEFNEPLKKEIRERDGYKCRLCNKPEIKKKHHVHHIFYNRHDRDLNKLITLCHACHELVHHQRKIWPPILQKKILL